MFEKLHDFHIDYRIQLKLFNIAYKVCYNETLVFIKFIFYKFTTDKFMSVMVSHCQTITHLYEHNWVRESFSMLGKTFGFCLLYIICSCSLSILLLDSLLSSFKTFVHYKILTLAKLYLLFQVYWVSWFCLRLFSYAKLFCLFFLSFLGLFICLFFT